MIVTNEPELRRLLNMQTVDISILSKMAEKICIDLVYFMETTRDKKMAQYALGKLEKIRACLEDETFSTEYMDKKHINNYYCRNIELILNEIKSPGTGSRRYEELIETYDNYIGNSYEIQSIYLSILQIRYSLIDAQYSKWIGKKNTEFLLKESSKVYASQPGNVLCKELIETIKETLSDNLKQLLGTILNNEAYNDNKIAETERLIAETRESV